MANDRKKRAREFVLNDPLVGEEPKSIWIGDVFEFMADFAQAEVEAAVRAERRRIAAELREAEKFMGWGDSRMPDPCPICRVIEELEAKDERED